MQALRLAGREADVMAMEAVQDIIIRAVIDKDFRDLFFNNREKALLGYELTRMEIDWLRRLNRVEFDSFAPELRSSLLNNNGIPLSSPLPS
jgi:hypothetical protein